MHLSACQIRLVNAMGGLVLNVYLQYVVFLLWKIYMERFHCHPIKNKIIIKKHSVGKVEKL